MDNDVSSVIDCMEDEARDRVFRGKVAVPQYFERKRRAIRGLALVLLLTAGPLMFVLCILIRLTSRGPAIFSQTRTGKDGQPFKVLKLRTMYGDAERVTGPVWCSIGDSRITPLGGALRFLHLDELPQLINVVRGEMDLVGPRPERPEIIESENLMECVPSYADRLRVLPGVTGLAQINLPSDQTIECVHDKVALDLEYINTAGFGLDLRILVCTALRMLGVRHGIAVRLLRLNRPQTKRMRRAASPLIEACGVESLVQASPAMAIHAASKADGAWDFASSVSYEDVVAAQSENQVIAALAHKHPR